MEEAAEGVCASKVDESFEENVAAGVELAAAGGDLPRRREACMMPRFAKICDF
jgi:hypothetical protein